jgi:uncharacterized membrane protein
MPDTKRIPNRSTAATAQSTADTSVQPRSAGPDASETALEENVQEIKAWELATLQARSRAERISDWVARTAASGPVMLAHVIWFAGWITLNLGWVPGVSPFDPFPFPFLTMTVSLEAIFLALFVLASQNRLARQTDQRSHLDLQIDLLAEREMTAVLQLLRDIATHLEVSTSVTADQLRDLAKKTDIHKLTNRVTEFTDAPSGTVEATYQTTP